jgi:hypothetical protein
LAYTVQPVTAFWSSFRGLFKILFIMVKQISGSVVDLAYGVMNNLFALS